MGIDYSASTAVGYHISMEELNELFGKDVEEESHWEKRFDERTGKELDVSHSPVKVFDQEEGRVLAWNGQVFGDVEEPPAYYDLVESLSEDLGCSYWGEGGLEEMCGFVLGLVPVVDADDGLDYGHVSSSGSFSLDALVDLRKDIRELGRRLQKLGFEVDPPRVFTVVSVS